MSKGVYNRRKSLEGIGVSDAILDIGSREETNKSGGEAGWFYVDTGQRASKRGKKRRSAMEISGSGQMAIISIEASNHVRGIAQGLTDPLDHSSHIYWYQLYV
jgi:hypothetical protein